MDKLILIFSVLLTVSIGVMLVDLPSRAETSNHIQLILRK